MKRIVKHRASVAPNKHQARTAATRSGLLDAAQVVFARDGFERAQLEAIAAEAGHTRGAVYAHFKNKQDLFMALLERRARAKLALVREQMEQRSLPERLGFMRARYVEFYFDGNWPLLTLEFKLFALRNPEYGKRLRELYQLLYADTSKLLFEGQHPISRKQKSRLDLAFATLRGIPSAVALESKFDPSLAAPGTARRILESLCDSVFREIASGVREPAARRRRRGVAIVSKTSSRLHRA
ncbi:MAG: TetR family transcriptional regulator [Candidatus Acidiferrales bacterium]